MNAIQLKSEFVDILQPLGANAGDFFLAASLYRARKVSFAAADDLAGLGFEEFHYRLREHFGKGFILDDETVLENIATVQQQRSSRMSPKNQSTAASPTCTICKANTHSKFSWNNEP